MPDDPMTDPGFAVGASLQAIETEAADLVRLLQSEEGKAALDADGARLAAIGAQLIGIARYAMERKAA